MALSAFISSLRLPVITAPMFLVSGTDLVVESCKAGLVGTFPALNARSTEDFARWIYHIESALHDARCKAYGVNLIVHKSNVRLAADLAVVVKRRVPLVITSLGAVRDVVAAVHSYGGIVLHDVTTQRHGEKALEAGVDGLIAVSAGAGGHAGTMNPFAMIGELRPLLGDKLLVLAGGISTGGAIAGAIAAGADLAYMGTRFIATDESLASAEYKAMLTAASARDIVYTDRISGVAANFLAPSLVLQGLDPANLPPHGALSLENEAKAWKNFWSAGHGVAGIREVVSVSTLVGRLESEYNEALARLTRSA